MRLIIYIAIGLLAGIIICAALYIYYVNYKRKTKENTYGKGIKRVKEDDKKEDDFIKQDIQINDPLICPRCGASLVLRKAKKGKDAGKNFYGCSRFPKCRYTRSLNIDDRE